MASQVPPTHRRTCRANRGGAEHARRTGRTTVTPRTAQDAMRHSNIDLTMNVYTDPKLLDVQGALDSLPSLDWKSSPSTERQTMRATGTDVQDTTPDARHAVTKFAPVVAPNIGQRGQSVSFAVISSDDADESVTSRVTHANPMKPSKKALSAVFAGQGFEGVPGWSRTSNLRLRRPTLYPIELRRQMSFFTGR